MRSALLLLAVSALLFAGALELRNATFGVSLISEEPIQPASRASSVAAAGTETVATQSSELAAVETPNVPPRSSLFRPLQMPLPTVPAATLPVEGERFELLGITGEPAARTAFFRDLSTQGTVRARLGDSVGQWQLIDISERCGTLKRGRETQNLCL